VLELAFVQCGSCPGFVDNSHFSSESRKPAATVLFILFESRHIPVTQHKSATPAAILLPGVGRNSTFTHKMYGDDSDELER
jgi:hypothetical protein